MLPLALVPASFLPVGTNGPVRSLLTVTVCPARTDLAWSVDFRDGSTEKVVSMLTRVPLAKSVTLALVNSYMATRYSTTANTAAPTHITRLRIVLKLGTLGDFLTAEVLAGAPAEGAASAASADEASA